MVCATCKNGDDWGMVYYCFTHITPNHPFHFQMILQNPHMYMAMSQNPHTHIYNIYIVVLTRPHICKMKVKWE